MTFILIIISSTFGLIIGSFLNVVICRLHTSKSLGGRSACMSCESTLRWYELIPLLSFIVLRGRCRTCKTRISVAYPLVEAATGLIFAALFFKFQDIFFVSTLAFIATYAYYAVMFSLLIVIAAYDLRHKIIPDILSFSFGALAFAGLFFFNYGYFSEFPALHPHIPSILELLSGVLVGMPFALFFFISSGAWMGFGDAKLAVGLGWLLGLGRALSASVVAFWVGAVVGLCLIVFGKGYGMKSEIPFALYLVFGAVLVFFCKVHLFAVDF